MSKFSTFISGVCFCIKDKQIVFIITTPPLRLTRQLPDPLPKMWSPSYLVSYLGTRLNLFGVTKKQFFDTVFCVGGIGLRGVGKWENHSEEFLKKVKMASK